MPYLCLPIILFCACNLKISSLMHAKLSHCKQRKHHQVKRMDHIEHDRANFDYSCLAPQLLQNFEPDFSLHPHSTQNLASKFSTSLAGVGWLSFSVGAIE